MMVNRDIFALFILKNFVQIFENFPIELIHLIFCIYRILPSNALSSSNDQSLFRINDEIYCSNGDLIKNLPVNKNILQFILCGDEIYYIDTNYNLWYFSYYDTNNNTNIDQHKRDTAISEIIQTRIKYISGNSNRSFKRSNAAITINGDLYMWGSNLDGQLALEKATYYSLPVRITQLSNVEMVCCGPDYTAAITQEGDLYTWGCNHYGQLGRDLDNDERLTNIPSRIGSDYISVSCGSKFTMAIKKNGDLYACGHGYRGQLGLGNANIGKPNYPYQDAIVLGLSHTNDRKYLTQVPIPEPVTSVSCGPNFTMAITKNGNLYSWGANDFGQLGFGYIKPTLFDHIGLGHHIDTYLPVKILTDANLVSCGNNYAIIMKTDNSVYKCGSNMKQGLSSSIYITPTKLILDQLPKEKLVYNNWFID